MAKKAAKKKSPAKKAATKKTAQKASSTKKVTKKSAATKASPAKKSAAKKSATAAKKKAATKKVAGKPKPVKKVAVAKKIPNTRPVVKPSVPTNSNGDKPKAKKLPAAFLKKQQQKLLDLRDSLVSQMNGVARETLRGSGDGSESAFGMHQADAGSDSYDRDFALNLLSQEQDALYEIDEALIRIDHGTYGICEESGEMIPQPRLEAMPFARLTVACQERLDQQQAMGHHRQPVTSLFGLDDKDKTASS